MSAGDKAKLDGIEPGATADQTAAEILAALKTDDGPGSGLDADTDGGPGDDQPQSARRPFRRELVKGQPKTDLPAALCDSTAQAGEVIPLAALKESINKAAYGYTDKHLGPKEEIGDKGGSLSNRLRAVLQA